MKKVFRIFLLAVLVSTGVAKSNEAKSQTASASVSFSVFYNSLKPYGRWMDNSTYGKVWVSNTRDFTPYSTGGHWAYTDGGWAWVSDYDWGWAPFHYGRWSYHAKYGWYWIPGYEWAPAWVAWRNNNDYYGWAPLSPGLNVSVGVSYGSSIPEGRWVFTPHQYITSPYVSRYYVPRSRNVTIIRNTTIVNNVTVRDNVHYVAGPRREDVERVNHEKVQTYTVASSSTPGKTVINRNTINVYRPVTNNNDKTVVNNDNTTVNKNSNNKTVNKNSNNKSTTVNKNSNNNNVDNNNKTVNKPAHETVKKEPQDNKKPADNASQDKPAHDNGQAHDNKAKPDHHQNASKENPQQKHADEVAKKKNQDTKDNNPPK
jgi:hypothetical protein